jgi:hypothetical protein
MDRGLVRRRLLRAQPWQRSRGASQRHLESHARRVLGQRGKLAAHNLSQGRIAQHLGPQRRLPLRLSGSAADEKVPWVGHGWAGLLAASPAFPCGGGFGPNIQVNPQQDIIVVWKDDVETYVFQPIFCGTATNFGLILPVPAQLTQNRRCRISRPSPLPSPSRNRERSNRIPAAQALGAARLAAWKAVTTDPGTTVVASGRVGFLDWTSSKPIPSRPSRIG